jgi:dTMP kinase
MSQWPLVRPQARLIAIIGIDGAGKSTQIRAVHAELAGRGHRVLQLPNESLQPLWERLDVLTAAAGQEIEEFLGMDTVQMAASAIKWLSLQKAWRTMDPTAGVVLADRYSYCQMAIAQRAGARVRSAIEHLYHDFPAPDLCIWLDVKPEVAFARLEKRGEKWTGPDFLETHRRGYENLAARHDFTVVDGGLPQAEVTAAIMGEIARVLPGLFAQQAAQDPGTPPARTPQMAGPFNGKTAGLPGARENAPPATGDGTMANSEHKPGYVPRRGQ